LAHHEVQSVFVTQRRTFRWASLSIALLALASSAIGILNGFTYDDRYIVEKNPSMHSLAHWWTTFAQPYWPREWGGDGYRPITILFFKLEYALGHGSPVPFHATNILLYAASAILVFVVARRVLPLWAAWLAAALFAVHPAHVEAVANVVGQSELLVAITLLAATALYLRDRQRGPVRPATAAWIVLIYAVGCFAKEHAIVLPAILLAAEVTVLGSDAELRARFDDSSWRTFFLSLALVAIAFIAVRSLVLSDHDLGGFTPFTPFSSLKITAFQRILTAFGVVPEWFRLFLFPAHLASEYGPPDIQIAQGVALWQLPGLLLLFATLAIAVVVRRREPAISFGIAFLCITLLPASNFLVPAGIVLAERTLFSPSAGAMIAVGGVAVVLARRYSWRTVRPSPASLVIVTLVLAAAIARSATRTRVWKDNNRLFAQAVVDSPDSYRAHYMYGAWHFENQQIRLGEAEYRRALKLFPYDPAVSYNMADQYRRLGMCEPALPLYKWTREVDPDFPFGRTAYADCLLRTGHYAEAKQMAYVALAAGGDVRLTRRLVAVADSLSRSRVGHGMPASRPIQSGKVP
jgi:hypothetical protein